jgi:hypothetical protein
MTSYHDRCGRMVEALRSEIGAGYGENDIEHITEIVLARLRAWDRLDREEHKRRSSERRSDLSE